MRRFGLALLCAVTLAGCDCGAGPTQAQDAAEEAGPADAGGADRNMADQAEPDSAVPDIAAPDRSVSDMASPDSSTSDMASPDSSASDLGATDGSTDAGYLRPFGPNAPWNVPVAGLPHHPDSDSYASLLWNDASDRPGNFNIGYDIYSYPVYYAADATDTYIVEISWSSNIDGAELPWNPAWLPNEGSDGQIILLDAAQGIEVDLWQVTLDHQRKVVSATNGSRVGADVAEPTEVGSYWTKENGWQPSRGCGIQYFAMLVVPEEVAQGRIEHALSMPIINTDGDSFVAPATKLEHPDHPAGIPEGMRFALDVTEQEIEAWLAALPAGLSPGMLRFAEALAVALRDYGWFITDSAGSAKFQLEAKESALAEWQALGLAQVELDYQLYPRDLLDGLMTEARIYALVPSDQY